MKKTITTLVLAVLFIPSVSFASDEQIKTNITSKLLEIFVQEVNGIDYINQQMSAASDSSQFSMFKILLQSQLHTTTQQIAALLDAASSTVETTPADKSKIQVSIDGTGQNPNKSSSIKNIYLIKVGVLNANGESVANADVSMDTMNHGFPDPQIHTTNSSEGKNHYTTFQFIPYSLGTSTITFTSGVLSKTITVEVK